MLAIITQLVASGILSIKIAAQGATFWPQNFHSSLSNELLFSLARKRSEPIHRHYCEHNKYTEGRGIISWWVFLLPERKRQKIKKLDYGWQINKAQGGTVKRLCLFSSRLIFIEPVNFLEELGSLLSCIVDSIETTPLWKVDEGDSEKNL